MPSRLEGWTATGWEAVRDAFASNFADDLEVGAAFSAYHQGRKVVDLWGGVADQDTGRLWEEDTIVPVFSTTKGFTAAAANILAQRESLDVDRPVADHWPEFEQNGKASIPVRDVLSHQAGLAWIDGAMTAEDALAWDPVIHALERQPPAWDPGTKHGYHATTFGWLVGELIRRISGRRIGVFVREEIAEPLGLDLWIGLPESEEPRAATLLELVPPAFAIGPEGELPTVRQLIEMAFGENSPLAKALSAPGDAFADRSIWNSRAMHAAEVPSANGIADARSLARMYAACIGEVEGIRLLTPDQLAKATRRVTSGPDIVLLDLDIQFGLGFMVRTDLVVIGGERSFGHFGYGGSFGWADPDAELAMGYTMNRLEIGLSGDDRSRRLIGACYGSLR
jgi:CubicO group peptidase (beta-lactamase class C family)